MGQEISQQNTCNIGRRQQQKSNQPKYHTQQTKQQQNLTESNVKYSKRLDNFSAPTPATIPNKSHRDELHRNQQHLATPHSYVKPKVTKKLSLVSNASTTSDYHSTSVTSSNAPKTESLYYDKLPKPVPIEYRGVTQHQRKYSQSNDSGIYYSSSSSSCRRSSSSAASICGSTTGSASTTTSCKSLDKQTNYLSHHLYIKSYLDILEEDEKARAHFQPARPGIRNYTPKILTSDTSAATTTLSTSVSAATKQRSKIKDDPWI